jgi:hypothetical protein
MADTASAIEHSERLTSLFTCWPSFHDAEVVELNYWRGDVKPGDWDDSNVFPVLTVKMRILGATQERFEGQPDVMGTLRFHDVDNFTMDGFNHSNQIVELSITPQERRSGDDGPHILNFQVAFARGFGMQASFRCFRVEVVEASVCI